MIRVALAQRTFLVKYDDTKAVKDDPELFSSNDPRTPMQPAFRAHTLMRKNGPEHVRERIQYAVESIRGVRIKIHARRSS